ncbi:alpha-ketoglutarate-dependent dioxygenase AlkB family protein [Croceibacter atlanticus]|uniref:alpha-ketoglutarate-dependent dioxygenase AlkB family protein n=1 Tax=Croceibacter atlanticus TaxID=313588 RepID=UPI0024B89B63|nr:alpha-ketoglutarate-dependent dioxygenase AlkB [Croceibacter atlanticus]
MNLFPQSNEFIKLPLKDANVLYLEQFYNSETSNILFNTLRKEIQWQQDDIKLFGKTYKQPRLTALYAENEKPYSYSNITMYPESFFKELEQIKSDVEEMIAHKFTTCLANLYRTGNDSNGWHSDNEKELGHNPVIASLSLGATRSFQLKHKTDSSLRFNIELPSGSLLIMKGTTQEFWKHQIPKTKKHVGERINLTFRTIH